MNISEEGQQREYRLRSGRDLLEALWSDDMGVRLATLSAIREYPGKALAFTTGAGRDVIDELIIILRDSRPSLVRTAAAAALFAFDDGRSLEEARTLFSGESDADIATMAGQRIGRGPEAAALDFFIPFLWKTDDTLRSRTAARLLSGRSGLQPGEQLRVALLAGETGAEPPALTDDTFGYWLRELRGALIWEARSLLMNGQREAFLLMKKHWQDLDPATRSWLVTWGVEHFQEDAVALIRAALSEQDIQPRLAALEAVPRYARFQEVFGDAVSRIPCSGDRRWTVAAVSAGAPVEGLIDRVFSETDADIRIAMIGRMAREHAPEGIFIRLLKDEDWRIRSAATAALVSLGEGAAGAVAKVLCEGDLAVRTAASQVLIRLGREDMLNLSPDR